MTDHRTPRTCGQCRYRIEGECRCCPPQMGFTAPEYPEVPADFPACSLWTHDRRGNQPQETNHE